jgi:hypothetical protein
MKMKKPKTVEQINPSVGSSGAGATTSVIREKPASKL